jgi:hypothetical protein
MGEAATREEAATTEATTRAAGKIAELSAEEKVSAATSLPKVQAATEKTTREVDRLLSDPGLDDLITGAASTLSSLPFGEALTNAYFGTLEKGSDAANAYAAHNVLTSVAFLQSYQEALKGTGAISNVEGLRAAQSNLQNALTQSPERYKERLEEFKQEVANVEQRVRDAAAKAVPGVKPTAPAAAPASNAIPPGWTFKVKGK